MQIYSGFKKSIRGELFCVPHNHCSWLDEAGRAEKRGSEGDTSPCRGPGACPGKAFQIEK
jgi:hypothetical protein